MRSGKVWREDNIQLVEELNQYFCEMFNANQMLLVKYLFRTKVEKSKKLILILILLMSRHHYAVNYLEAWFLHIIFTLPYWKREHFVWAVEHDIGAAFMCSFMRMSEQKRNHDMTVEMAIIRAFHVHLRKLNLSDVYLENLRIAASELHIISNATGIL